MHETKHTTASNTLGIRPGLQALRAGDDVLVYDGVKERNIWQRVEKVREVAGRLKIRVEGTDFFFDSALVISVGHNPPTNTPAIAGHFGIDVLQNAGGNIGVVRRGAR